MMGIFSLIDKVFGSVGGGAGAAPSADLVAKLVAMPDAEFRRLVHRDTNDERLLSAMEQALAIRKQRVHQAQRADGPVFPLGTATGRLLQRNHSASMKAGEVATLTSWDLYEGLAVIGPMGSGKTRTVLTRLAGHWLAYSTSGMFANGVKPSWSKTLVQIARMYRSDDQIHVLGPDAQAWNLIHGLSPDAIGQFARAAFDLHARGHGGNQFFSDSAANIITASAMLLHGLTGGGASTFTAMLPSPNGEGEYGADFSYSLASIYDLTYIAGKQWDAFEGQARQYAARLDDIDRVAEIVDGLATHARELGSLVAETRSGVIGQIASCLSAFRMNSRLRSTFCGSDSFDLSVLDQGHVVILDVDLDEFPRSSELVYLLGIAHLRKVMMRRERDGASNPVLLLMDEFNSVATSDMGSLFRMARSAKIAVAIAFQLVSDLNHRCGGQDGGRAIVNQLRNLVVFPTGDSPTLAIVRDALGKAEVLRENRTRQRGRSLQQQTFMPGGMPNGPSVNWSESTATNIVEREVVDQQLIRTLRRSFVRGTPAEQQWAEAVAVLSVNQQPRDDVIVTRAWDPPKEQSV